jgi:predicted house-cleaning noncanonical NTP pyrophosphatase (MazG superfamily)
MKVYNKLVRDKIPEIIKADGNEYEIRTLNNEEYLSELNKKLGEELKEYYESGEVEELADIAEIIYAIAKHKGVDQQEFDSIRKKKAEKRGGFEEKIFLISVKERGDNK